MERTIVLNSGTPEQKRAEIRHYFHATFDIYEKLFDSLNQDDAYYVRPEPLRHPLIFYFGHTATFFINKLVLAKLLPRRINPAFESMFAIGVDEMSWDDLNQTHYDWPTVAAIKDYRRQVRQVVDELIVSLPLTLPITWESPFWAILMGIEHDRIHLETSSVIIRRLDLRYITPNQAFPRCPHSGAAPQNELLPVAAGCVVLGKDRDQAALYGWDNEYGRQVAMVSAFNAGRYLVSNEEFLAFVQDGGYRNAAWWTEEGRQWLCYAQPRHPLFWIATADGYRYRALLEEIPMPWNWPVDVNYLEAKAFCQWKARQTGKNIRLPTEDEWYLLHDSLGIADQPDWDQAPGNIALAHYASACPVDQFRFGEFYDVIGNVWQWTETTIDGFPGFQVHPLYDDFSTPTFDAKHNLIKGGSWISTGNEAIRDSRYAFRRHFFQHAGFRYVESDAPVLNKINLYETDALIAQYCEFHYGGTYFGVANFPQRCADICLAHMAGRPKRRALDLGCAVGRSTFELARGFDHVTGIDFSARFIRIGVELQESGLIKYVLPEEGELVGYCETTLAQLGLQDCAARVEFWQGDAHNLKPQFTGYDLIFCGNLIDRLYDPGKFLADIHQRLHPGGLLVITSPYTWLTEHTERGKWLGGFKKDGEVHTTLDGLEAALAAHFVRIAEPENVEFVIRETRRKYQHTLAELTVWQRKGENV
ncbi:MAG: 5-histidylcysteine sulfoxide synthase [Methylococcaceae bacterium]|nr:MAG: 5-histidylcysteine sulfoxide synthase [Methylococcaceae bacterium]